MLGPDLVVRGEIVDRQVDNGRIGSDLFEQVAGDVWVVRSVAVDMQCLSSGRVPSVQQVHALAAKHCAIPIDHA